MRPGMLTGSWVKMSDGSAARSVGFSRSDSAQLLWIITLAAHNTHVLCVVMLVLVVSLVMRWRGWTVVLSVSMIVAHRVSSKLFG